MTNKQQRNVIHLAGGSILGIMVYAPADLALSIRPYVQFGPLVGLSGLWVVAGAIAGAPFLDIRAWAFVI